VSCKSRVPRGGGEDWATRNRYRLGARQLLRDLQRQGHELWIYTISYRDPCSVWWWLGGHGIWVQRVLNQDIHDRTFRRDRDARPPSKNPRAFGIHLHIDDSIGVAEEGRQLGFRVLELAPEDPDWTDRVRNAVR
jgi:hypothetical protein